MANRALQEELSSTTSSTNDNDAPDQDSFDPVVFWGVNIFLSFMLIVACTCCCICGKKNDWNCNWLVNMHERRRQTDEEYRQRLRQQFQELQAAERDTPAVRKAKLLQSFQRHQVSMVRRMYYTL
jgi:hypothetical protein